MEGLTADLARWPNFFVIGAAKCGTTSLHEYVARHPDVFMSELKEPHFFASFELEKKWMRVHRVVRDETTYLRLFSAGRDRKVIGEASASYLWDAATPARIDAVAPEARLVAVLRDPVERAYSHYLNDVREGIEHESFSAAIQEELSGDPGRRFPSLYVDVGRYAPQLERYLPLFRDRLRVLFFDDLVRDPAGVVNSVFEFLGLQTLNFEGVSFEVQNAYAQPRNELIWRAAGTPRLRLAARALVPPRIRPAVRELLWQRDSKPALEPATAALLADEYRPEIALLEELLGRPVPWREAW